MCFMLNIISTPIGNLGDITYRAVEVLKSCDVIYCEDTRRSRILFNHYGISKKLVSLNDNNMKRKISMVLDDCKDLNVGYVSDAGTPGISDPGFYLIREAISCGIEINIIPGVTALITGLIGSGIPMDKFFFYGFLPKTIGKKKNALELAESFTVVYYESPYRIMKTLELLSKDFSDFNVCVARELTKKFEEFIRGSAKEVFEKVRDRKLKGEIVLIISKK